MATILWTIFAVAMMIGIFASCVVVVAAGVRWLEGVLAKRRLRRTAP
jgi:hypothetical protein